MSLPDQPPTFRQPTPAERPWWWRMEDAAGAEVRVSEAHADARFPNQGDAESWVGEVWRLLADEGVEQVTLFDLDRRVYGPMSLRA